MFLVCKVLDLFFARTILFRTAEVKGFNFLVLCRLLVFLPFISLNIYGLGSNRVSNFNLWHLQSIYHACTQAVVPHVLQTSLRCKVKHFYPLKINQNLCGAWERVFEVPSPGQTCTAFVLPLSEAMDLHFLLIHKEQNT